MKNRRINEFLITFFLVIACSFSLFAQINNDIDSISSQLSTTVAQNGGLLWKVSGNGLAKSSYIFGTYHDNYHSFTENQIFSIPGLKKAIEEAEEIATEDNIFPTKKEIYTMFDTSPYERLLSPSAITRMPKGKYYSSLFKSYKEWRKFDKQMKRQGFFPYLQQKPTYWMNIFNMKLTMQMALPSMVDRPSIPIDLYIAKYAREKKTPMFFLNAQYPGDTGFFGIFDPIYAKTNEKMRYKRPLEVQIKELCKLLNQIESPKYKKLCEEGIKKEKEKYNYTGIRDSLFNAYKTMDIKKIEKIEKLIIKRQGKDYLSYRMFILDGRNIRWIPIIKKHMAEHVCFIAFGCRHLVGETGIINLLRKEGYEVTPVF
jgi:Uncharacterized protein conserved in bacteria